jgi:ABC-type dipeptide/oligopeptide/nickel transport system permease component
MAGFVLRRGLIAIPTLWVAVTLVFFLFRLIPGDPAQLIAGELAPQQVVENIRHQMGYDQPLPLQYLHYLTGLAQGDLGISKVYQQNASAQLVQRAPATFELAAAAMLLAILLGIMAGVASAVKQFSWIDYAATVGAVAGISIPAFWLGLMLISLFAVELGWAPTGGFEEPDAIILPAVTLAGYPLAVIARQTRSAMLEVLRQEHVRTARAKGLPEWSVIGKHALRNSMITVTTLIGLQLGALISGAVVTETIFGIPGFGRLTISAVNTRDYTLIQGVVLVAAAGYVVVNLTVDVLYSVLNPRIRIAGARTA